MNIVYYHFIWLLIVIPIAVHIFQIYSNRQRMKDLNSLGELTTVTAHIKQSEKLARLKYILFVLALILLVISALRPQWGIRKEQVARRGLDIVIVLDTSASMFAEDIQPTRISKSILEIKKLLSQLGGDRVGLVTFAGSATAI